MRTPEDIIEYIEDKIDVIKEDMSDMYLNDYDFADLEEQVEDLNDELAEAYEELERPK